MTQRAARSSPVVAAPPRDTSIPASLEMLAMGYVLMLAAGFFVLRQPWVTVRGNEFSADRAVFVTLNAATLTGFSQPRSINDYATGGQIAVFVLMLGGTFFSLLTGGWAVARIARLDYSDAKLTKWTSLAIVVAALLGMTSLWGPGVTVFAAAFNGVSALGNSGLYMGKVPRADFWSVHLILLPLALVGGWGVAIVRELYHGIFHRAKLSRHARATIYTSCGAFIIGALLLFIINTPFGTLWRPLAGGSSDAFKTLQLCFTDSAAAALNSRTAGFSFTSIGSMPRLGQWTVLGLMLLGGASGGAAGGLKLTTLYVVVGGVRRALRGATVGRAVGIAMVWVGIYLAIVLVILFGLLATQPELPADRLLTLAVSAVSNVGLSHDPVAMVGPGLFVLSLGMLLGRVAPMIVLWWVASTAHDADVGVG